MTFRVPSALAALLAIAALTTASAHAEEAPAGRSWTGAYVGAGLGIGHLTTDQYSPPQLTYDGYPAAAYAGWHPYGSVQAGADLQLGGTVLGLKLQHSITNSAADSLMKVDELVSSNAVALTSLSARAGYLLQPQLLGYVSASVVAGQFNYASIDERWGLVDDSLDTTRIGWGLGAGVEYRLTDNLSAFAEYSYVRFATARSTFDYGNAFPSNWTYEYRHDLGTFQTGLNFRF